MHEFKTAAIVAYSPQQLFDLVTDIAQYPTFLSWCSTATVLSDQVRDEVHCVDAEMSVQFGPFAQSFTTRNTLEAPDRIIMDLIEGPFSALQGVWHFEAISESTTRLSLEMAFEFSSELLGIAFRNGFEIMAKRLVRDFSTQADARYGHTLSAIS